MEPDHKAALDAARLQAMGHVFAAAFAASISLPNEDCESASEIAAHAMIQFEKHLPAELS